LLICLMIGTLGCRRTMVRPERLDEADMRAWIGDNFAALEGLEQSWRGVYEEGGQRIPFRLDLWWNADSTRLSLLSPFGGELAVLRCRPDAVGAAPGASLGGWLSRAARLLEDEDLGGLLDLGAGWLADSRGAGVEVDLKDPALAPLLALIGAQLPGHLLAGGLCRRESLAPWLWGEWLPPAEAVWRPADRQFVQAAPWRVHPRVGLVERAEREGWVMELDEFERTDGIWLAGRLRLGTPDGARRLTLQNRGRRVHVTQGGK
jgi:hypothetical protein